MEQINIWSLSRRSVFLCFLSACVHTGKQEVGSENSSKEPDYSITFDVELSRDFKENIFNPKHLSDLDTSLRSVHFNKKEQKPAVRELVQTILALEIKPELHFIERFFVSSAAETLNLETHESELLLKWIGENALALKKLLDISNQLKSEEALSFVLENENSFKNNFEKILKIYLIYSLRIVHKSEEALFYFQQQQQLLRNFALMPTGIFNEDGLLSGLFVIYRTSLFEAQLFVASRPELKEKIKKILSESFLTRAELKSTHLANAKLFFWTMRYKQFFIQMGKKFRLASYPLADSPEAEKIQLLPLLDESLILQSMSTCTLEQLAFIEQLSLEDENKKSELIGKRLCLNEKSKPLEEAMRKKAKILPEFYLKLETLEKIANELGVAPVDQVNQIYDTNKTPTINAETKKQLYRQFLELQQEIADIVKEYFGDLAEQQYFSHLIIAGSLYTGAEASLLKTWKTWDNLKTELSAF